MGEYEKIGGTVQKARCPRGVCGVLAMTAAAGEQNDGNDDQPKGAVVKQIAKAVIHSRSSIKSLKEQSDSPLCYHTMTKVEKCARNSSKYAAGSSCFFAFPSFCA